MQKIVLAALACLAAFGLSAPGAAHAAERVLFAFGGGAVGQAPMGSLVVDRLGNLYGTTYGDGGGNGGSVFRLSPPARSGTAWTMTVLHQFGTGLDGKYPMAALVVGKDGAFYGTTNGGGRSGSGTVFRLAPPAGGQTAWTESVIHSFCPDCDDGIYPQGSLLVGADGSLYGTASEGGGFPNKGTVFRLTPPLPGAIAWDYTVIYRFCSVGFLCSDGSHPLSGLIADASGHLYGTTEYGGANDDGAVFRLSPPARGTTLWTSEVLYDFCSEDYCFDGYNPVSGLSWGMDGALYGTTFRGGSTETNATNRGVAYRLLPPGAGETAWTYHQLHRFTDDTDGAYPSAGLLELQGEYYGTTQFGGTCGPYGGNMGTIYKLTPTTSAPRSGSRPRRPEPSPPDLNPWAITILSTFCHDQTTANDPNAGLIAYQGGLYGTTVYGGGGSCLGLGTGGCGTVFRLVPGDTRPAPGRR